MEEEVGISEKRCPSPLPSALRAAFTLFAYAQPPPTATQPPASATRPSGSGTTPASGNCQLPEHLESDSIATVRLSAAPERTSLVKDQQLDYRGQHSHDSLHGKSFFVIHQAHVHLLC